MKLTYHKWQQDKQDKQDNHKIVDQKPQLSKNSLCSTTPKSLHQRQAGQ